jgi:hypothetical protein
MHSSSSSSKQIEFVKSSRAGGFKDTNSRFTTANDTVPSTVEYITAFNVNIYGIRTATCTHAHTGNKFVCLGLFALNLLRKSS